MVVRPSGFIFPKGFIKYICPKCGQIISGLYGLKIIHEKCKIKFKVYNGGK